MRQYTEEFEPEIVELAIRSGKSQSQISCETSVIERNISRWIKEYKNTSANNIETQGLSWQNYHTVQAELRRVIEERDILKNVEHFLPERLKRYAFMEKRENDHSIVMLCEMMNIKRGSFLCLEEKKV